MSDQGDIIERLRNPMWAHSNFPFESPQLAQEENQTAMTEAADEIASLRAQLASANEKTEEVRNYWKEISRKDELRAVVAEAQLASARKALEFIRDGYDRIDINHVDFRVGAYKAALSAISDENGKDPVESNPPSFDGTTYGDPELSSAYREDSK